MSGDHDFTEQILTNEAGVLGLGLLQSRTGRDVTWRVMYEGKSMFVTDSLNSLRGFFCGWRMALLRGPLK